MAGSAYVRRVQRVTDHVRKNLADDLPLADLAGIAGFSPFHFHRIFRAVTGETLAAFTRRARIERAVYLMRGAPDRALSSIATEVGFSTPSDFSRVFRKQFGCSPSDWDRRSRLDGIADLASAALAEGWDGPPWSARVVQRPARRLVYLRVRDPWTGTHLAVGYRRLLSWLDARGIDRAATELWGVSWDSEKSTPMSRLVYDLGFAVGPDVHAGGELGVHVLPAGPAVEVRCRTLREIAFAWDHLYGTWLPASSWEPADAPAAKRFCGVPEALGPDAWHVDCSIALRAQRP